MKKIFLAMLCVAGAALAAEPVGVAVETITSETVAESDGAKQGGVTSTIRYEPGKVLLVEDREQTKGGKYHFEITFDPATLHPSSWSRVLTMGAVTTRTEVAINGKKLESKTYEGGKEKSSSSTALPASPFCIAPLLRFGIANVVASGKLPAVLHNVTVADDGSLKAADLNIEDLGTTTVEVSAGKFECRRLRVAPKSSLVSALVPPGEMFIGKDGTHPMVKIIMAPSRVSGNLITELKTHNVEPAPAK